MRGNPKRYYEDAERSNIIETPMVILGNIMEEGVSWTFVETGKVGAEVGSDGYEQGQTSVNNCRCENAGRSGWIGRQLD